jgi:hypothetical protein
MSRKSQCALPWHTTVPSGRIVKMRRSAMVRNCMGVLELQLASPEEKE